MDKLGASYALGAALVQVSSFAVAGVIPTDASGLEHHQDSIMDGQHKASCRPEVFESRPEVSEAMMLLQL